LKFRQSHIVVVEFPG